ncbi:hypothetical protein ABHN11_24600 [Brevibacillus centrosporus]|uniref:hypothetical protein n=1 Tax=Brevibacillus centrosporus TaxID=54910 RepID=UPI003D1BEBD6
MQADAIAKLKTEMAANKTDPYIQTIGDFLLRHLDTNSDDAEKLLSADKTIVKSLEAMKAEARKKQKNGMAMLTDSEAFTIVLNYFGIKGKAAATSAPTPTTVKDTTEVSRADFDVKLDDFL